MRCRWDHNFHPRVGSLNASSLVFYRGTSATFYVAFVVVVVDVAAAAAATFRKTHGRPLFQPFSTTNTKPKISINYDKFGVGTWTRHQTSENEWVNEWISCNKFVDSRKCQNIQVLGVYYWFGRRLRMTTAAGLTAAPCTIGKKVDGLPINPIAWDCVIRVVLLLCSLLSVG
jgi:hypothetical protein